MILIAFATFIPMLIIGVPIAFSIGLSGVIAILASNSPIQLSVIVQQICGDLNSFPLMACPFFILAGELMGQGGLTPKIVGFCSDLLGWLRGGISIVSVGACMIFAGISGSGAADTSAIGALTIPAMKEKGYDPGFAASLVAAAGALGPVIPPSMNMIIYASLTGDSVAKLFMGGIVPGLLIGFILMLIAYIYARTHGIQDKVKFSFVRLLKSFWQAVWALICPLIILGGIISGIFTATEAGIIACVYAVFCGTCIYKKLTLKGIWNALHDTCSTTGMVMLVLSFSAIYAYMFSYAQAGNTILDWMLSVSMSNEILLLIVVAFSVFMGCFMDMLAVMMVIIPVLYPVIVSLGIDVIQFGVMFCIGTVLGGVTPPVGIYLYITMGLANTSMSSMVRYAIPMILVIILVMCLSIFVPEIVTFVPSLLMK